MVTKIGLDLGYANITLGDVTAGIYREPSVAVVDKVTGRILSLGNDAINRTENSGIPVRPFKNGLLYSQEMTGAIIENAIKAIMPADKIRCVIGLPSNFLPKQERELFAMVRSVGVQEVYGVTRSVAALIGAGYAPSMSVISVNVGAKYTDISVLFDGKVIQKSTAEVGGENFDIAVKQYIQEHGDVSVSLSVARAIKEKIGAVWEGRESESIDIEGTLSLTGNKVRMNLVSEDILGVFEKPLHALLFAIADVVKKIPYDKVTDIFKNGIVLSGGGAMLFGLDKMIAKVLDIPTTLAKTPMDCVAKGLSRINTFLPMKMHGNEKNITSQLSKFYQNKKKNPS